MTDGAGAQRSAAAPPPVHGTEAAQRQSAQYATATHQSETSSLLEQHTERRQSCAYQTHWQTMPSSPSSSTTANDETQRTRDATKQS